MSSLARRSLALDFAFIDFLLSESMVCETWLFHKFLGDLLKCFRKVVHPMDGCLVERRFQMILSMAFTV